MSMNIRCSMELKLSGKKISIGSSSENAVQIKPISLNNVIILGVLINKFSVTPRDDENNQRTESFILDIDIENDIEESQAIIFIQNIARHITFLFAKYENNPQIGLCYAELNLFDLKILRNNESLLGDKVEVNGKNYFVKMSTYSVISTVFKFDKKQWEMNNAVCDSLILDFYYEGIKANTVKSKFFHWFSILESIEHSNAYQRNFSERLFNEEELKNFTKYFEKDQDKYNAIMSLKGRLKGTRSSKLYEILQKFEIRQYNFRENEYKLEENTIKKIIDCRNKLFHQGQDLDENLLWNHLFPIVREIVETLIKNPKIFD